MAATTPNLSSPATGEHEKAIALYERNLADRERVLGASHADTLASRYNLACAYEDAGRHKESADHQQALADCHRVLGPDHPFTRTVQEGLSFLSEPAEAKNPERHIRRRSRP